MKILNFKLKICLTILLFFLWYGQADAATLSKAPNNLGLVGYWSFDEATGTKAMDFSGNGNNGTVSGATWVDGKFGKALSFSGSGNVAVSDMTFTNKITISAWAKSNVANPSYSHIVSEHPGWFVSGRDNSIMRCSIDSTSVDFNATAGEISGWHLYTCVYDGSNVTTYLDGKYKNQLPKTGSIDPSGSTRIGNYWNGGGFGWNGSIDDVRIYNRVLTVTEIQKLYGSGSAKTNASQNSNLTNGLVGLWSFDGKDILGTTAYDRSGSGNNGTITGATEAMGKIGQALSFSGSSSYVDVGNPSLLDGMSELTVSFWAKHGSNSFTSWEPLLTKGDDSGSYRVQIYWNNTVQWVVHTEVGKGEAVSNFVPPTDTWFHVVGTYKSGVQQLYINGVPNGNSNMTGTIRDTNYNVNIGRNSQNTSRYWNGSFDDVRIYNRALSATEVKQLYGLGAEKLNASKNVTNSTLDNSLVGLWSFDGKDISGATAYDRSGSGKNGTITGATKTIGKIGQALKFNGSTDQILISDTFDPTVYTYSMWVKPNAIVGQYIFTRSDSSGPGASWSHQVRMDSSGHFVHYLYDGGTKTVTGSSVAKVNNWYFITIVSTNNGYSHLYVNGTEEGSPVAVGTMWAGGDRYFVGTGGGGNAYFNGSIDDIRMYNRVLSVAEIKQLYLMGK